MSDKYDVLKIDNQLCFPLYACAKEIVRKYKPFLDERNLIVRLSEQGEALKEKAMEIPHKMSSCVTLSEDDAAQLYRILHKLLQSEDF